MIIMKVKQHSTLPPHSFYAKVILINKYAYFSKI